jgi:hypothetical protein
MLCPNCKNEIENGSKFCEYCGARVKKSKKWLWVALAVTLLVGGAIVVWYIVDTSDTYYETAEDYRIKLGLANQGFVDLGLPSGTLWKQYNEDCTNTYYTYEGAFNQFGTNLPTKEQFEELQNMCSWYWRGSGYQVIGPNGYSIYLPAAGYRYCGGDVGSCGMGGYYWSSTSENSDTSWGLDFDSESYRLFNGGCCYGRSVRLVMNP